MKRLVLFLAILFASAQLHSQETRYIRDQLYVPLRSGQTMQHRIVHKGLVSGTQLTVIETSEDEKYSLVRTNKGTEGWIQSQYLSTEPAGRNLLKVANKQLAKQLQKNRELAQQLNQIQSQQQQAKQQIDSLSSKSSAANKELLQIKDISANTIQINSDNQRLLQENQLLKNEVDVLGTDNQRLNDEQKSDAFLSGAYAVLLGVFITLLVPRLWPKKRTEWN